ncbi:MAG: metallophosphoesterase [Gammaproteobacteria bacterium]
MASPSPHPWACLAALALLLALAATPHAEPLRVAVISDLNGAYGTTRYAATIDNAIARIIELDPDLVISTGDMVAGQRRPHLARPEIENMWHAFHAHVSAPLAAAGIPLAVTPGNHDASAYPGFDLERRIFDEQWRARSPSARFIDRAHYPFRYAFAQGGALFISLDMTTAEHLSAAQTVWLRALLAEHGGRYEYRVIFGHLPLWPLAEGRESEYVGDTELQAMFEKYQVDLVLSGHHHAFYPGAKDGVAFVAQSCLGAGPRTLLGAREISPRSFSVVALAPDGVHVGAFAAPDFTALIDWRTLPREVRTPVAVLTRADLVPESAIAPAAPERLGPAPDAWPGISRDRQEKP